MITLCKQYTDSKDSICLLVWGSLYIKFHELHVMDFGNDGTCVLYGKLYMTSL